jgi:peptide/nickel transport system permease protein
MPKFVLLWTDAAVWLLVMALAAYVVHVRRTPNLAANWRKVFSNAPALASSVVLLACLFVTLADSVHYRSALPPVAAAAAGSVAYDTRTRSLLDAALAGLVESRETTYSRPLDTVSFTKESGDAGERIAPRLLHGGAHLSDPASQWAGDVALRAGVGLVVGLAVAAALSALLLALAARAASTSMGAVWRGETVIPWRAAVITLLVLCAFVGVIASLARVYHVFGTDITGNDVLFQTLKSIRTAVVIGALATLATLPLAVVLGIMAGYFRGWVDEAIQSSTPCSARSRTSC